MTYELNYIRNVFKLLNRINKLELLETSNLKNREIELLTKRFINGETLKECAEYFGIEEDSVNKAQLKAVKKLYQYLKYT